jgi:hypothetical protein
MDEKKPPPITVVEWTDPTRGAVVGWLFAAMFDSGQWADLELHVHGGQLPRIVGVRHKAREQERGRSNRAGWECEGGGERRRGGAEAREPSCHH